MLYDKETTNQLLVDLITLFFDGCLLTSMAAVFIALYFVAVDGPGYNNKPEHLVAQLCVRLSAGLMRFICCPGTHSQLNIGATQLR